MASIMIAGTLSQAMANEPDLPWGEGRFSPLFPWRSCRWRNPTRR